jgi:hypothetical protein
MGCGLVRFGKRQQQQHQSDEQQDVHDLADGVHTGNAERPDDEQGQRDLEEHRGLPQSVDPGHGIARFTPRVAGRPPRGMEGLSWTGRARGRSAGHA